MGGPAEHARRIYVLILRSHAGFGSGQSSPFGGSSFGNTQPVFGQQVEENPRCAQKKHVLAQAVL